MKILFVSDAHRVGGAEHYLLLLAEEFVKNNHDVHILCPDRKEWQNFTERLERTGVKVHRIPLQSRHDLGRFYFLPFLNLAQISRLEKCYTTIAPEIIHINTAGVEDGQTCVLAAKKSGMPPFVITNHAGLFNPYRISRVNLPFIDALRRYIMRSIDKCVTHRIAVSQATADLICRDYGLDKNKFSVVHNGLSIKSDKNSTHKTSLRQKLGVSPTDTLILSIAHLYKEKGLDYLLKAFKEGLRHNSQTKLLIAGDGPYRDQLRKLSINLSINERVKFLGPRTDTQELLDICDIFVLPSLGEGFPFVILEAMAASLPIISTNVGGIPEMINSKEEGLLVAPADEKVLVDALLWILTNRESAHQMGAKARVRVEKEFSILSMSSATLEIYRRATT